MRKLAGLGAVVLFASLLAGCSTPVDTSNAGLLAKLRADIHANVDCPELYKTFDQIDENSVQFSSAQGQMINIGCYTTTSARNDAKLASLAPGSPWLGVPGKVVTPSDGCIQSVSAAADVMDNDLAEPLIAASLDACGSVNEWMSALQKHPGAMGMIDGYIPQLLDLQTVCYTYIKSKVCQDALSLGISVGH